MTPGSGIYSLRNIRLLHTWLVGQPACNERNQLESILCDLRSQALKAENPHADAESAANRTIAEFGE